MDRTARSSAERLLRVAQNHRLLVLLGSNDGDTLTAAERAEEDIVREHVELLLHLALHVLGPDTAENVLQPRPAHFVGDDFCRY
jgi:hypothetical protein